MTTTRRTFLATSAAASTWLLAPRFALTRHAATDDSVLVVLCLGGGNDGLNTVIPCEDDLYYRARPALAIQKTTTLPFASGVGFHPALTGLRDLADAGRVAVVSNVGYPNPDRSHFRSMDIWQSGSLVDAPTRGFLAPLVDRDPGATGEEGAIAVVEGRLPLAMIGERRAAPVILSLDDFGAIDEAACLELERPEHAPVALLDDAYRAARRLDERLASVDRKRGHGLPGSKLGRALSTVLDLLSAGIRPRVFYVAHDGFDTHVRQADAHAALLRDFGDCVRAFDRALPSVTETNRVVTFAFSEFGRRVAENDSLGTDHGTAAPVFVIGRDLVGGFHGDLPDLKNLEDGDLRYTVDFRAVLGTLMRNWLGIDETASLGVEARTFAPIPLFRRAV